MSYIAIKLDISSNTMSADEITDALKVAPTYIRLKGAPMPRTGRMRQPEFDKHEWQLREQLDIGTPQEIWDQSGPFITSFLTNLQPLASRVSELSRFHEATIGIVYFLEFDPYLGVTAADVRMIAALGAGLDFDVILTAPEEDE